MEQKEKTLTEYPFMDKLLTNRRIEFSKNEYDSIRSELITRIGLINSQSNAAIVAMLATWTMGFALVATLDGFNLQSRLLSIINTFIFLVPVFYYVPLAVKSGENIQQIASISAYIRVFYEYRSLKGEIKMVLFNWETSNNLFSSVNVNRGKDSTLMKMYNNEYTILSLASLTIYIIFAAFTIKNVFWATGNLASFISTLVIILLGGAGCAATVFTYKASCMKNAMMKNTNYYIGKYIDRAIELGCISAEEREPAQEALNSRIGAD